MTVSALLGVSGPTLGVALATGRPARPGGSRVRARSGPDFDRARLLLDCSGLYCDREPVAENAEHRDRVVGPGAERVCPSRPTTDTTEGGL
jgi:hypothetical protein